MALSKSLTRISLATGILLLIPLLAMQFTHEVNWTLSDFVVAGVMLFGTGAALELVAAQPGPLIYRLAATGAILTALLQVWVNLAVGFIGSGPNPANLLCGAVPVIGLAGAFAARFQPRGMAYALAAAALVQVLVPVLGKLVWNMDILPIEWGASGAFALLWLISAWLFQRSATNRRIPKRA